MDNTFTPEKLIQLIKNIGDRTEFASDDQLCKLIGISEDKYKRILGTKKGNRDFPNTYDPKLYTGAIEYIIDKKAAEHRIVLEKIKRFVDENKIRDDGIDRAFADLESARREARPDDEVAAECLDKVLAEFERIIALRTYGPSAANASTIAAERSGSRGCEPDNAKPCAPAAEPVSASTPTAYAPALTPRLAKALLFGETPVNPNAPLVAGPSPDDRAFLRLVLPPDLAELVVNAGCTLERFMAGQAPAALASTLADRLSTDEGTRCAKMLRKCSALAKRMDAAAFFAVARYAYRELEEAAADPKTIRSARSSFSSLSDGDAAKGVLVLFLQAILGENQYHRIRSIMAQPAVAHASRTA